MLTAGRSLDYLIHRLGLIFQYERRFYRLLAIAGGITALLKGMRLPYIWAATQAQIDYRHGYIRRGLFGEVCGRLHIPIWRYGVFSVVAFALLAALFWMLARSMSRSGLHAAGRGAFTALLASSFCITMLTNLVGYYDILMALLVLAVMQFRNPRAQLVAALIAGIIGVLVHELYAIAYLPVSLAGLACALTEEERRKRWLWAGVAAVAIIPWVIVLLPAGHAQMAPQEMAKLAGEIRARVNFSSHDGVLFAIFGDSSRKSLGGMLNNMHAGTFWVEEGFGFLAFLPTTLFFLALAWRLAGERHRALRWYLVLCTFAPLLLNLVAYDRYRWLAMMELNAVLCAITVCWSKDRLHDENEPQLFSLAWRRAAIFLIAINLATDIGLFQGPVRNFPFQSYWTSFQETMHSHKPLFSPPDIVL
jgi:uncharacterized membrane protein YvlD (DUF360 family)